MKNAKWIIILLAFSLVLTGCARKEEPSGKAPERYQATYLSLFDTVTTIVGYAGSEEEFNTACRQIHDEMLTYHRLYDIYNEYDGLVNLKIINEKAPYGPVKTDRKIIDLILFAKEIYEATDHKVNIALGSVLSLWHEAREDGMYDPMNAYLPD
ncbi:MAG: FAD:protein FMN transferase, partial [Bullifex sp.]